MKLIRHRRPSLKTALGVTKMKRSIARATGIPTTKSGRKRKAMNALTGGAYGKYQRTRAEGAGQPEARDLGFLPRGQKSRKQKTLQP